MMWVDKFDKKMERKMNLILENHEKNTCKKN